MDHALVFTRHYARLVWLLIHEPENVEQQKASLRAAVSVSMDGPVRLAVEDWRLTANGESLPDALAGVQDLSAQMIGHAVRGIDVDLTAAPADLLGAARLLAGTPVPGDGGLNALQGLSAIASRTVRFTVGAPAQPQRVSAAPQSVSVSAAQASQSVEDLAMELELLDPEEAHAALAEKLQAEMVPAGEIFTPAPATGTKADARMAAVAALVAAGDVKALFAEVDAAQSVPLRLAVLDALAGLAERSARDGKAAIVGDVLFALSTREAAAAEGTETKKALGRTWRRLCKPPLLRQVAALLPRKRGPLEDYEAVLVHAGEEGAEALIDQLTEATTAEDRRVYYNLLLRLRAGVPSLVHMLGDQRWFVVRNAADLLGEMRALEAEKPLITHMRHPDERVRRAACIALVRLATPGALRALRQAVNDPSPELRQVAAGALAQRREDGPTGLTLVKALEGEADEEVQLSLVAALGRVATPDAVQRLIALAEPGGRIFNKKSTALRVAAVLALGEARSPAANATLAALAEDREREVREAVAKALSRS
jgi:hypothetical protein